MSLVGIDILLRAIGFGSQGSAVTPVDASNPLPVVQTGTPALATGAATSAKQDTGNTSVGSIDTKIGEVQASPTANTVLDRLKALLTGIVLSAGSAIIGKVGIDQTTPGTTNAVIQVPAYKASKSRLVIVAAASNNATNTGAANHQVFNITLSNKHASNWAVLKIYNQAGTPAPASDTPVFVLACGPGKTEHWINPDVGFALGTGLAYTIVQGFATTDNTAIANAADAVAVIEYI